VFINDEILANTKSEPSLHAKQQIPAEVKEKGLLQRLRILNIFRP
jgi:hypothetical protein